MNNKSYFFKFFPVTCLALMVSCTQKDAAQVDYYGKNYYGRSGVKQNASNNSNLITVKPGDSLLSLSNKYKVNYNDLLKANNLNNNHVLKVGQKLRIPNNDYHKVKEGETLSKIAKQYNIPTQQLAEINNLEPPYTVKIGQSIAISSNDIAQDTESPYTAENNDAAYSPMKVRQLDAPDAQSTNDDEVQEQEESEPEQEETSEDKIPAIKRENEEVEKEQEAEEIKPQIPQASKFIWPVQGAIVSNFGPLETGGKNDGINIEAPEGTAIKAAASGVVAYSGNGLKGYGNLIILKHADGTLTAYAHQENLILEKDAKVKQGQVIGNVGATGNVSSPQLHFAVRKGKKPVDPLNFLPKNN